MHRHELGKHIASVVRRGNISADSTYALDIHLYFYEWAEYLEVGFSVHTWSWVIEPYVAR